MFISYSIEEFIGKKIKREEILIHRLENLDYLPPKNIKSPHKHLFYELYFIEEGHAIHNVDFATYEIKNNQLFFINQEQVHLWEKNISKELKGYRILFTDKFLENSNVSVYFLFELMYIYQLNNNPLIPIPDSLNIHTYARLLQEEYLQDDSSIDNIKSLLFLFLNEIKRNLEIRKKKSKKFSNNQIRHYKNFLKEVEKNYYKDFALKDYAECVNLSTRQLSRMVKQISNTTLNNIVLKRRIQQSKRLLKYSDLSISEIAYNVGFKEASYFSKTFKKQTKKTPLQFKKDMNLY